MILTARTAIHYLLDQGLLSEESVVQGDVVVVDAPRRNKNFHILRRQGPGLFLKQVQAWDAASTQAVKREAFCYWLASGDPEFSALGEVAPKYRHYDPSRNILVTDLVPGDSVQSRHQRDGRFPPEIGTELGRQMARYHRGLTAELIRRRFPSTFPAAAPWILSFHQQSVPSAQMSAGNAQLLSVLQRYPDLPNWLEELRGRWTVACLIHGDMKWDNCLLEVPSTGADGHRLRIVDWELADLGDPAWDLGAALQAYLSWWIFSMQPAAGIPAARLMETARTPLAAVLPAVHALWNEYVKTAGPVGGAAAGLLKHAVACAAARMVQTVYEHLQFSAELTPQAICLLQVSLNMLEAPERAARELLAL